MKRDRTFKVLFWLAVLPSAVFLVRLPLPYYWLALIQPAAGLIATVRIYRAFRAYHNDREREREEMIRQLQKRRFRRPEDN